MQYLNVRGMPLNHTFYRLKHTFADEWLLYT